MNYLYNGKELPKIPVVEGLAFSFIDNEGLGYYGLYLTPNLPVVKQLPTGYEDTTGDFLCNIMGGQYWRYVPDVNSWVFDSNIEADEVPIWSLGQGIWSNHNVYNEDGTLYLAASDPVPVLTRSPAAMALGWLAGMAVRRMRGQKTLVGYLYNGVGPLPALPSDLRSYKYFCAHKLSSTYCISGTTTRLKFDGSVYWYGDYYGNNAEGLWELVDGEWSFYGNLARSPGQKVTYSSVFWASHDIRNTDGSTYLAASEPVPVYE